MIDFPRFSSCAAVAAPAESPALRRLRLLDARIAPRRAAGDPARRAAQALTRDVQQMMIDKPDLGHLDLIARLRRFEDFYGAEDDEKPETRPSLSRTDGSRAPMRPGPAA